MCAQAPLGSLRLIWTRGAVFIAQTILALPYVVALSAAAIQALPGPPVPGAAARRRPAAGQQLALREARIGVIAAIIAALGTALSEVAAISIIGGNIYGYDQTLASATLFEVDAAHYADAVAIAIVLIVLILILMCGLGAAPAAGRRHPHALPVGDVNVAVAGAMRPAARAAALRQLSLRRGRHEVVHEVERRGPGRRDRGAARAQRRRQEHAARRAGRRACRRLPDGSSATVAWRSPSSPPTWRAAPCSPT